MQNTFGRFIIKAKFSYTASSYLRIDLKKPPLSIHAIDEFIWVDSNENPTEFSSTDCALPWVAFVLKQTQATAVEIVRL